MGKGRNLRRVVLFLTAALALGSASACGDDDRGGPPVDGGGLAADGMVAGADAAESGRRCSVGLDAGAMNVVASPALECQSRTCAHVAGQEEDLCAAPCSTASDCLPSPETPCQGGFACEFVVSVGPFACRKYCLCQAYVPDGGLTTCN